jgi:hypothetical protein
VLLVLAPVFVVWLSGKVAPWGSTLIWDIGVLQPSLHPTELIAPPLPTAPSAVWLAWTLMGAASAGLLVDAAWSATQALARQRRAADADTRRAAAALILLAGTAGATLAAVALVKFFDRYLLPLIPLLAGALVIAARLPRIRPLAPGYDGGWDFGRVFLPAPSVAIAFGDRPGFRRCAAEPFQRWMPPRVDYVFELVPSDAPCPSP